MLKKMESDDLTDKSIEVVSRPHILNWAAIYGVAQSRKRLKRLSSSSRSSSSHRADHSAPSQLSNNSSEARKERIWKQNWRNLFTEAGV